ncbi:DUF992 domain-containing protein [Oricola cellulosilytica]|uniref:DUF992 domain-containing protein n=1 Tax=Oricola cellulosilytica TaxID=1429082 RepID=A0A4R0PKS8_9HYPH|nr:DUF992 domain-containing protein [Oricola cellulosilytica]TCD16149.1 DUF992 domain-containing protein [Oricola cellulosilytica]
MRIINILAAAAIAASATVLPASAEVTGTKVGSLDCEVEGGIGLLIGSSKKMQCTFSAADGSSEDYTGTINKLGLDVGITGKSYIKWIVFTPAGSEIGKFALAGKYAGVSTGLSLGIGLGANALVGGQEKNIGLQPLSIEGQTGLNVALAVSQLSLQAAQ